MLTDQELRQALFALSVIEARGDRDEWAAILRDVNAAAPAGQWGGAAPNQHIGGSLLAGQLAGLLGESRERCEAAAADVFGNSRQRAIFAALVRYAAELTGQSEIVPYAPPAVAKAPAPRQKVRFVSDSQRVA